MRRALLLALVLAACDGSNGPPAAPAPGGSAAHATDGGVAATGPVADASPGFIGVIAPSQLVDIAPQVPGVLASVSVRAGDPVKAGDAVAEMDPNSMQDQLRAEQGAVSAAEAAYTQAGVDLQEARRRLKLETQAVKDGISPRQNVDEARSGVKRAEAALSHAAADVKAERARLDTAKKHVADTTLKATFDGIVSNRYHDGGATVQAGEPIVRIVRLEGARLKFAVPAERAKGLTLGQTVTATVDGVAAPVTAAIRQISPAPDPSSQLIFVEAEPSPSDAATGLRPGLGALVRIP
jgi:membrane fusion protein, multidrug efflux system